MSDFVNPDENPSPSSDNDQSQVSNIPDNYYCPISYELLVDPVIDIDGYSVERKVYETWIAQNGTTIFTRRPMTVDQLVPNRNLKDAIDLIRDSVSASDLKRVIEKPNLEKVDFCGTDSNPNIRVILNKYENNDNNTASLDIKLEMPIDALKRRAAPVHLCLVVDVSYSMETQAEVRDSSGNRESHGLCILDIVKHAAQTCRSALCANDYMSIIVFHDNAEIVQSPILVDNDGSKILEDKIHGLQCKGSTNMWDACKTALDLCRNNVVEGINQRIFLLTDGQPNPCPSRGFRNELVRYDDNNNGFAAPIDTFGFGYALDSAVLDLISRETNGYYSFIPDVGMVGDLFGNALANFLGAYFTNARLSIDFSKVKNITDEMVKNIQIHNTRSASSSSIGAGLNDNGDIRFVFPWSNLINVGTEIQFDTGTLIAGQNRNFTIELIGGKDNNINTGDYDKIEVFLSSVNENKIIDNIDSIEVNEISPDTSISSMQKVRMDLIACLKVVQKLMERKKDEEAAEVCNTFIDKYECLESINGGISKNGSEFVKDISGEVMTALSKDNWERWGKHYLPSLINAHIFEYTNNWKDHGVQVYAGELFLKLRDEADDIFNKLPPPQPSNRRSSLSDQYRSRSSSHSSPVVAVSMNSYNVRGGVCFHPSSIVYLNDGSTKAVADVAKGDVVRIKSQLSQTKSDGDLQNEYGTIECIVRTYFEEGYTAMCRLSNGLICTPHHPVLVTTNPNDTNDCNDEPQTKWVHPKTIRDAEVMHLDYTYSFLLQERSSTILVNNWICGTLAHGINEPVIGHEYFGTEKVVDDLKRLNGWDQGLVTITPDDITRDPKTGWINGIVDNSTSNTTSLAQE